MKNLQSVAGDLLLIGVLALQGDFAEHLNALRKLKVNAIEVRNTEDLKKVSGLIIPGGESTAIAKLLLSSNLGKKIKKAITNGMPVFGTCAGAILLAKKIIGKKYFSFNAIDVLIQRNAFGRQLDSFQEKIKTKDFGLINAVFIRAPKIKKLGRKVKVLAMLEKEPILCEQNNILIATFHPELSGKLKVHEYFIEKCLAYNRNQQ